MSINVTEIHITERNKPVALTSSTGTSAVNGTAEIFEFEFPCKDEKAVILIHNGGSASVTAQLSTPAGWKGKANPEVTVTAGGVFAAAIESGSAKDANGKVSLKVTPASGSTVSGSSVKVYGLYQGVKAE